MKEEEKVNQQEEKGRENGIDVVRSVRSNAPVRHRIPTPVEISVPNEKIIRLPVCMICAAVDNLLSPSPC